MTKTTKSKAKLSRVPRVIKHLMAWFHANEDISVGVGAVLLLMCFKMLQENSHWEFGRMLDHFGNSVLQKVIAEPQDSINDVIVVDISNVNKYNDDIGNYTPRNEVDAEHPAHGALNLERIIRGIAEFRPRAIGVDVDLSPNSFDSNNKPTWLTDTVEDEKGHKEDTAKFLEFVLKMSGEVPLALGVHRQEFNGPDRWLGNAKYKGLAGSLDLSREQFATAFDDYTLIPYSEGRIEEAASTSLRAGVQLKTLGAKLAEAPVTSDKTNEVPNSNFPKGDLRWREFSRFDKDTRLDRMNGFYMFTLNTGMLEAMQAVSLQSGGGWTSSPNVLDADKVLNMKVRDGREKFAGKIVLLGNVAGATVDDAFHICGFRDPIPGVLIHASSSYTLRGHFVYRLTWWSRLLFDLILSLALVWTARFVNGLVTKIPLMGGHGFHHIQELVTIGLAVATIFGGVAIASAFSVLWTDFVFVAISLFFHEPVAAVSWVFLSAIKKLASLFE